MNLLTLLLFFALPLGEVARIHSGEVAVGLIDLLMLPAVFLAIRFSYKRRPKLLIPIVLTSVVFLISLVINLSQYNSSQTSVAFLYLLRWVSYSSVYFMILNFVKTSRYTLYRYMFFSGYAFLFLGYFQYFFYSNLKNLYYLGWDEHMHRLFGTFLDPNFAGIFITLFFFFSFLLREKIVGESRGLSFLVIASIPLSLVGVVLTYSRSALVALLGGLFIYCVLKRNVKLLLGIVLVSALIMLVLSRNFYIENTNLFRTVSSQQRLETMSQGIEIFKKSPIFGVGFNALRYARDERGFKDRSLFGPSHSGAGVDNSLIFVLVTSGLVGLVSYLYLMYSILLIAVKKTNHPEGVLLLISVISLTISSLFINSLFFSFLMIWLWSLAAISERT